MPGDFGSPSLDGKWFGTGDPFDPVTTSATGWGFSYPGVLFNDVYYVVYAFREGLFMQGFSLSPGFLDVHSDGADAGTGSGVKHGLRFINDLNASGDFGLIGLLGNTPNPGYMYTLFWDNDYGGTGTWFGLVVKPGDRAAPNTVMLIPQEKDWQAVGVSSADLSQHPIVSFVWSPGTVGAKAWRSMGTMVDDYAKRAGLLGLAGLKRNANATAGTGEEILATYTLPGGSMSMDNNVALRITAKVELTSGGATKVGRIRFGGIGGTILASRSLASGSGQLHLDAIVVRASATSQDSWGKGMDSGTGTINAGSSSPAQTLANDIDIVVTGQTTTAAQTVKNPVLLVEYLPLDQA